MSELKAKFERLARIPADDRAPSGTREIVLIRPHSDPRGLDTIAAILQLKRGGLTVLRAKRAIEAALADGFVLIDVPQVANLGALERAMENAGFEAKVRSRAVPDVRALRERLGLSQEQFAIRFGLEVDAVRNWEHERRAPDMAARSLLKVIALFPDMVAQAQDA